MASVALGCLLLQGILIHLKKVLVMIRTLPLLLHDLNRRRLSDTFEDHLDKIPKAHLSIEDTLVVYTPAIPKEHRQLHIFKKKTFKCLKRSEVLGINYEVQ